MKFELLFLGDVYCEKLDTRFYQAICLFVDNELKSVCSLTVTSSCDDEVIEVKDNFSNEYNDLIKKCGPIFKEDFNLK